MSRLVAIFCELDDFCNGYEPLYTQGMLQDGSDIVSGRDSGPP
jgi:hypothetical protein